MKKEQEKMPNKRNLGQHYGGPPKSK